jgi:hypothetical protein
MGEGGSVLLDEVGSYTETYSVLVLSGASNFQLMRAPWPSPVNKMAYLLNVMITPQGGGSGAQVVMWDQDLSNSTPPTRGSAGGAILILGAGASSFSGVATNTTTYSTLQMTHEPFVGGIAMQASQINTLVSARVKIV